MGRNPHWTSAIALALTLAACNNTPSSTPENPYANGAQYPWKDAGISAQAVPALTTGYLSDQQWSYATNGWGPVERDKSNGEQLAGDGHTLSMNGKTYTKGLGVHANSVLQYNTNGLCTTLTAEIGLDDEVRNGRLYGSVVFIVGADGAQIYNSGLLTKTSPTKSISLDISGKSMLDLRVDSGPDNNFDDHADWANIKVSCKAANPNAVYVSDLPLNANGTTPTNGWGPIEKDMSNGEQAAGDGHTISIRGQKFVKGIGMHAVAQFQVDLAPVRTTLNCAYPNFLVLKTTAGIDDEVSGSGGAALLQVATVGFTGPYEGFTSPAYALTANGPGRLIEIGFTAGVGSVRFQAQQSGSNVYSAHVSLGDARFECTTPPTVTLTVDKTVQVGPGTVTFTATVTGDTRYVRKVVFYYPRTPPPGTNFATATSAPYTGKLTWDGNVPYTEYVAARAVTDSGPIYAPGVSTELQIDFKKAP
jgi:NPCBM/NEW2 domain